jgi:hypothetical protein
MLLPAGPPASPPRAKACAQLLLARQLYKLRSSLALPPMGRQCPPRLALRRASFQDSNSRQQQHSLSQQRCERTSPAAATPAGGAPRARARRRRSRRRRRLLRGAMAQRKPLLEAFKFSVYIARECRGLSGARARRGGGACAAGLLRIDVAEGR